MFVQSRIASLNEKQLSQIRSLEKGLSGWIVALNPRPQEAKLSEQQLKRLQELEKELNVILVAYEMGLPETMQAANIPLLDLSAGQLQELQNAEKELGLILLVFKESAKN